MTPRTPHKPKSPVIAPRGGSADRKPTRRAAGTTAGKQAKDSNPAAAPARTMPHEKPEAAPCEPKPSLTQAQAAGHQEEEVVLVFCADAEVHEVTVAGTFNGWSETLHPLHRISPKTYATKLRLPPGEHHYKFVVDGMWIEDPDARSNVPDGHGGRNSVLVV